MGCGRVRQNPTVVETLLQQHLGTDLRDRLFGQTEFLVNNVGIQLARQELMAMLQEEELSETALLVFANK